MTAERRDEARERPALTRGALLGATTLAPANELADAEATTCGTLTRPCACKCTA
jgi:hypothetical protein